MESMEPLANLREWAPLSNLLNKIPVRVQKGFLYQDVNIQCVNVLPNFIALGTNVGIVFWYNRSTSEIQKLKCEHNSRITSLKIISSVEYLVAAGSSNGHVTIFVIQKEHSIDLKNLVGPVSKPKPIERYTIKDIHESQITCVEWSKNGMKLFSGDQNGVVYLTEFDYQTHLSKSIKILNEAYEIVQISFNQSWLLISTIYRAIICERDANGKWNVLQIGKRDRKVLSDFGAIFIGSPQSRTPNILCSRPGFRFWIADTAGNVSHTYLLKDAVSKESTEISLLNPKRMPTAMATNFGRCHLYMNQFLVTENSSEIFIINLDKLTVEATVKRLRKVINIAINENEIFIVEGARSVIRLATAPEPPDKTCSKIIFNPILSPTAAANSRNSNAFVPPVEFEAEEDDIINAEECFELPPIEQISLETPLRTMSMSMSLSEHNLLPQDQIFLEHSKRAQIFEKINHLDYDKSILFTGGGGSAGADGTKKKKLKKSKNVKSSGIVEIGQQADVSNDGRQEQQVDKLAEAEDGLMTRPCLLDVSFCEPGSGLGPDLRSPNTINRDIETKEKLLAVALNIEPIKLEQIPYRSIQTAELTPDLAPEFHSTKQLQQVDPIQHTTPLKRIHFLSDDLKKIESPKQQSETLKSTNLLRESNVMRDIINRSDVNAIDSGGAYGGCDERVPEIKLMPSNVPKLWNVKIERCGKSDEDLAGGGVDGDGSDGSAAKKITGESSSRDSSGTSDWELV